MNIDSLKVLFSTEEPVTPLVKVFDDESKKAIPGSVSFVPSAAGLLIASQVIKDLLK